MSLYEFLIALASVTFGCYSLITLVELLLCYTEEHRKQILFSTPKFIYDRTKLNMPSCILFSIPAVILYYIGKFIYYISHVGRKD